MNPTRMPLGIKPQWLWREERMWELILALGRAHCVVEENGIRPLHQELLMELHQVIGQVLDRKEIPCTGQKPMTATEVLASHPVTGGPWLSNLEQWNEAHRGMGDPTGKSVRFEHGETRITEAAQ